MFQEVRLFCRYQFLKLCMTLKEKGHVGGSGPRLRESFTKERPFGGLSGNLGPACGQGYGCID